MMYEVNNSIASMPYSGLSVSKLRDSDGSEVLLITLEKGHDFPKHSSPRDAMLIMLEGEIIFKIQQKEYSLRSLETFEFPAKVDHSVHATNHSKFLIIR